MEKIIVDRFEGDYAICEKQDRSMINIMRSTLPVNTVEGSCLILSNDGSITIDKNEYHKRKETIHKLMGELFE